MTGYFLLPDVFNQHSEQRGYPMVKTFNPSAEKGASFLDALVAKGVVAPQRTVNLRCGSSIKPLAISWLWEEWIPAGKLTVLAGTAGTGKTTLVLGLAAALTSCARWPDGTLCKQRGNVLIWSSEDNPDDTLVPRLIASGADMKRCFFIDGITEDGVSVPFDPSQDIPKLHQAVEKIGGVSLLIIDPIVSAVAGDMHRANDVRRSLQAVVDFAEVHGCAVIGITHFAKNGAGKAPQDRVIGSQAFSALARMVLVAAKEENGSRRVLARAKSNIAPDDGGVAYRLDMKSIEGGIEVIHVVWEGAIEGTAREILGDVEYDDNDTPANNEASVIRETELDKAEDFLEELLTEGAIPTTQIYADAKGAGFTQSTIRRAKASLGIEAKRVGEKGIKGGGVWHWESPDSIKALKNDLHVHTNNVSTLINDEHLNSESVPDEVEAF